MVDLCRVTGTMRNANGDPLADEKLTLTTNAIRATEDGAVLPDKVTAITDDDGYFDAEFLPGSYEMFWSEGIVAYSTYLNVPPQPAANLESCIWVG